MRFTTLIFAGIFAVAASAQSASSPTAAGTTAATVTAASVDPAQTSAQAAMIACINACTPGDVACTSKCIAVPNPNNSQVNQTNECVAECPKGNGTATDNLNYANCVNGCIAKFYYTTSGTPQPTTAGSGSGSGSATATATGTGAATGVTVSAIVSTITSGSSTFATTIGSTTVSGTATGAATSSTSKAAADMLMGPGVSSSIGLLGFLAALLAI